MQLKNLFDDDTAVSPVIGVILMVAITVILAAVIGTFVLGLGDSIGENAPSATYDWDQPGDNVTLTHQSGENINPDRVSGTFNGAEQDNGTLEVGDAWANGGDISSGDTVTFNATDSELDAGEFDVDDRVIHIHTGAGTPPEFTSGDEFRVIWTASGGGSSSTLTTYTYN